MAEDPTVAYWMEIDAQCLASLEGVSIEAARERVAAEHREALIDEAKVRERQIEELRARGIEVVEPSEAKAQALFDAVREDLAGGHGIEDGGPDEPPDSDGFSQVVADCAHDGRFDNGVCLQCGWDSTEDERNAELEAKALSIPLEQVASWLDDAAEERYGSFGGSDDSDAMYEAASALIAQGLAAVEFLREHRARLDEALTEAAGTEFRPDLADSRSSLRALNAYLGSGPR